MYVGRHAEVQDEKQTELSVALLGARLDAHRRRQRLSPARTRHICIRGDAHLVLGVVAV